MYKSRYFIIAPRNFYKKCSRDEPRLHRLHNIEIYSEVHKLNVPRSSPHQQFSSHENPQPTVG